MNKCERCGQYKPYYTLDMCEECLNELMSLLRHKKENML